MNAASSAVAKAAFVLLFWTLGQLAWAVDDISITELTGTVSAQGADGAIRVLAQGSILQPGDILQTEKDSAVNLKFSDGGKIALRANSRFVIENYRYNLMKPEEDNLVIRLLKGGMRSLTGLISKRGNQDAYQNRTLTSTIGIRGTDYALLLCAEKDSACATLAVPEKMRTSDGSPPAGLYLSVFQGKINAVNRAGDKDFPAEKHGYVRDFDTLPQELEDAPGLNKEFMGFHGSFDFVSPLDADPEACVVK